MGQEVTKGLGAGADPELGKQAAHEDRERIESVLQDSNMVFITAGMGGGTGTGAAPVVAEISKELGALTVAVVTRPFPFEGKKRHNIAEAGIAELQSRVDSLIVIPNEKVLAVMGHEATLLEAFSKANEVLLNAVQGISELITRPGLINVDFADVRTVMSEMGMAMMGSASASGENRAVEATHQAINSPLLEDVNLHGAKGLLINITAGPDMTIGEFEAVGNAVHEYADIEANMVIGTALDATMKGDLRVTMVATGLADMMSQQSTPRAESAFLSEVPPARRSEEDEPMGTRSAPARRHGNAAPSFSADRDEYMEIPTFLRQQAD